ncbi:hypothetical protein [Paenibacillus glycanilyticus]|uniref:hypothetical protein n=1 Tax=Paenibacillus glycanilyticus TaxID=126569 RepID=UPI001910012F|nr:hypothetical protein [Paenibacillus glycanilyticus]
MKYFKSSLWSAINSGDLEEQKRAEAEWRVNDQQYWTEYLKLESRLGKELYEFFHNFSFHDYDLKEYKLVQSEVHDEKIVDLYITVTGAQDEWTLVYNHISRVGITMDSTNWLDRRGFDDWGYDELLIVDKKTLSHEILFASGAGFLVHFSDKNLAVRQNQ